MGGGGVGRWRTRQVERRRLVQGRVPWRASLHGGGPLLLLVVLPSSVLTPRPASATIDKCECRHDSFQLEREAHDLSTPMQAIHDSRHTQLGGGVVVAGAPLGGFRACDAARRPRRPSHTRRSTPFGGRCTLPLTFSPPPSRDPPRHSPSSAHLPTPRTRSARKLQCRALPLRRPNLETRTSHLTAARCCVSACACVPVQGVRRPHRVHAAPLSAVPQTPLVKGRTPNVPQPHRHTRAGGTTRCLRLLTRTHPASGAA